MQPDNLTNGLLPNPFDGRDFGHVMGSVLATVAPVIPSSRYHYPGLNTLNQGNLGACVGFTGENWLQNSPVRTAASNEHARFLYYECKKIDGIPNIEGTYSRALLEVLRGLGKVKRYLWATTPVDLKDWVLGIGPVLVGTTWRYNMFNPAANGFVSCTGEVVGGHEYLVRGYSRPLDAYRCRNSWGAGWGIGAGSRWAGNGGEFWIKRADLEGMIWPQPGSGNWGDAIGIEEVR